MSPLRIAVLGTGHLGSRHAQRLAASPDFRLTHCYDRRPEAAATLAGSLGCVSAPSLESALGEVEAVVVATSTGSHREVAEAALVAGKHVLVEKPLTGKVRDAEHLIELARRHERVLHVGHVERFNPALRDLLGNLPRPLFVESHRLAPLVPRSLDIDVVQDLMIHDIDLTLAFVGEEPDSVEASGVAVLTDRVDIANARLRFPGGATANLTASRVSLDRSRKFRMFLQGTYISADCGKKVSHVYRLRDDRQEVLEDVVREGGPLDMLRVLDHRTLGPDGPDALDAEHAAFAAAIRGEKAGGVPGTEAVAALKVMVRVEEAMQRTAERT